MKKCNAMESCTMLMTFFPYFVILILIKNFFGKHRLTILLKEVIIHATLSYLLQISLGTPSECVFCLI